VTQGGALRWWMEPFQGSQIKVNPILLYKPNTLKGLHLSAMGNTHHENGEQKHVSNAQGFKPIAITEFAVKIMSALSPANLLSL